MIDTPGVFVTGTDTDVGKTVVAACLVEAWAATYWKPVQTGLAAAAGDTDTVATLAGLSRDRMIEPVYAFQAPLSPHAAAAAENATIALEAIRRPRSTRPLVVEGAGGVLVPLNESSLMADLICALELPAIVVARTALGTINHTLLSLEALRARHVRIAGVILNGPPNPGNRDAIARFGHIRIVAELPRLDRVDRAGIRALAAQIPALATVLG